MVTAWRSALHALVLFLLSCTLLNAGCTCDAAAPAATEGPIPCRPQHPTLPAARPAAPGAATAEVGALQTHFSVTSTGEASLVLPLAAAPGRAGVEPRLALSYDSGGKDGPLGVGFSLTGPSAITRCPKNLARDGEIRAVRYDADDALCLDDKRLVPVREEPGIVEYRTLPDTATKIVGHYPEGDTSGGALFFEVFAPSGLVTEYGTGPGAKPRARGGAPRTWLATVTRDGRGNAMTYGYCFAEADGYTAEYALDEIRYTRFDGSPSVEASRAVKLVYGTKDPADVRRHHAGGMALQASLRLEEMQMIGPDDTLVRRYGFTYALGQATGRTLLAEVEECGGDGACKPPTRFQYHASAPGFERIATGIAAPTSRRSSPMLADLDGDGLDDLVVPDMNAALSTPESPITDWLVARNRGPGASPPYFSTAKLAFSQTRVSPLRSASWAGLGLQTCPAAGAGPGFR
jgi:hypothetical protein